MSAYAVLSLFAKLRKSTTSSFTEHTHGRVFGTFSHCSESRNDKVSIKTIPVNVVNFILHVSREKGGAL